jgi:hydrogen peroxide-dependent heme synthase
MSTPPVKLTRGIHVLHAFYQIDRLRWSQLPPGASRQALDAVELLVQQNSAASHPRLVPYINVGGKADFVAMAFAEELGQLNRLHRRLEQAFPPGTLHRAFTYLSVTELPEYVTTEADMIEKLQRQEKLTPGSDAFNQRLAEERRRQADYETYRLYPELPDWEVMAFYPMSKRRQGNDNWYSLDFDARKRLMAGHARVGRKFAGRISQLITGSTGIDDWEWGVTLMAHQLDALKDIVYEMRFDEVSARYGEFGPFYINLRQSPAQIWQDLGLS